MDIEEMIEQIVNTGSPEDMHLLSDMLEDTLEELCEYNEEKYKQYELKLYKIAYGNNFTKQKAEEVVSKMRPYGQRWSIEETEEIQRQYGMNNINLADFYIVINSAFNDYHDIFNDNIEMYVRFTSDFINDEDAKEDKTFRYFTTIPD